MHSQEAHDALLSWIDGVLLIYGNIGTIDGDVFEESTAEVPYDGSALLHLRWDGVLLRELVHPELAFLDLLC